MFRLCCKGLGLWISLQDGVQLESLQTKGIDYGVGKGPKKRGKNQRHGSRFPDTNLLSLERGANNCELWTNLHPEP